MYEIEFYVGSTEYDMDVDVNTGKVTDFSVDYHRMVNPSVTNSQPVYNTQPSTNNQTTVTYYEYYYDDDPYDYDDMYDFDDMYDYDDMFDFNFFD